jgi:hypothetical protein
MIPQANPKVHDLAVVLWLHIISHMEEVTLRQVCPQSNSSLEGLKAAMKLAGVQAPQTYLMNTHCLRMAPVIFIWHTNRM